MNGLTVLKKCCFCVPLRYGLLTWGYIKLGLALLVGTLLIVILAKLGEYLEEDKALRTTLALIGVLMATEIIIHIVFIVGAHKKKVKLLKVYYYYAIFVWVALVVIFISATIFLARWFFETSSNIYIEIMIYVCPPIIFCIAVQTFLLVSIRSEIIKLRSNSPQTHTTQFIFVKNDNELDGTINPAEEEVAIDAFAFNERERTC